MPDEQIHCLVTGATGYVGARLVPQLLDAGHRVRALARTPEKRTALEALGARAAQLDLFDPAAVRSRLAGHDVVVNLAGSPTLGNPHSKKWADNLRSSRVTSTFWPPRASSRAG